MLRVVGPIRWLGLGAAAPPCSARRALWRLVSRPDFEFAATATLAANAALLCTQHAGEPAALASARDIAEVSAERAAP